MKIKSITVSLLMTFFVVGASFAQQNSTAKSAGSISMVGKETTSEFDSQNKKGAAAVNAVAATSAKLSTAD